MINNGRIHCRVSGSDAFLLAAREMRGFTVMELLVAMAVASLVAMSGFALFSQSNWSYQVQESVGEAQQNARVAMDRMARDIRTAGFGLPDPPYNILGFNRPITVSDRSDGPDTITILGIGYAAAQLAGGDDENRKGREYLCASSTISDNYVTVDGIFFAEVDHGTPPEPCAGITGHKIFLEPPLKLKGNFKSGTVYAIQAVEYSIVDNNDIKGCSQDNPCLASRDYSGHRGSGRQLLAENIEDIQFAYARWDSANEKIDCTGAYTSDCFEDSPDATKQEYIRAIRVTLSARTRNRDPKRHSFTRPEIENHPESDPPDNYRRRTLTKIVKLRN